MKTSDATLQYWAWKAERQEKLADRSKSDEGWRGRAAQPHTAGWQQYHRNEQPVRVIDGFGKERWITPTQARVLQAARTVRSASMATIASSLGVAASTVYRALLRLASMGLVSYDTKRGRSGGVTFVQLAGKALEERAQAAWEKLKHARQQAARRWMERLVSTGYPAASLIIAPIEAWTQRLADVPTWTPDELAAIGL